MVTKKDKLLRKAIKRNDQCRQLLTSLQDSPIWIRLRYELIIILRLGYRDLAGGNDGAPLAPEIKDIFLNTEHLYTMITYSAHPAPLALKTTR
jgi:hypothetical protein